jgi:hypothetical protein
MKFSCTRHKNGLHAMSALWTVDLCGDPAAAAAAAAGSHMCGSASQQPVKHVASSKAGKDMNW